MELFHAAASITMTWYQNSHKMFPSTHPGHEWSPVSRLSTVGPDQLSQSSLPGSEPLRELRSAVTDHSEACRLPHQTLPLWASRGLGKQCTRKRRKPTQPAHTCTASHYMHDIRRATQMGNCHLQSSWRNEWSEPNNSSIKSFHYLQTQQKRWSKSRNPLTTTMPSLIYHHFIWGQNITYIMTKWILF